MNLPRVDPKVREKILKSRRFQDWFAARRKIRPVPADPFRAFMIDLSLEARVLPKDLWKPRTNWSDYPPIDLPRGVPSRRRRMPSRKEMRRMRKRRVPKPARPVKETPFMKELRKRGEKMLEQFHLPAVEYQFVPERGESIGKIIHKSAFLGRKSIVRLGLAGGRVPTLAVQMHELGHHAHYAYRGVAPESIGITKGFFQAKEKEQERIAWRIADPFLKEKRALQKWTKRYYLGTYFGISPQ